VREATPFVTWAEADLTGRSRIPGYYAVLGFGHRPDAVCATTRLFDPPDRVKISRGDRTKQMPQQFYLRLGQWGNVTFAELVDNKWLYDVLLDSGEVLEGITFEYLTQVE
jgi:hypothetical protein